MMKYVVIDLSETSHGGTARVCGYLDEAGLDKLRNDEDYYIDPTQGGWDEKQEQGIIWLNEEGELIAIPIENLANFAENDE